MQLDQHVLSELVSSLDGKLFALDFETFGTNWMAPGFWVRCCSFHTDEISLCVELADEEGNYHPYAAEFFEWLASQPNMIAHNAGFEVGVIFAMTDIMPTPKVCTYALLAALMNEGSPGASWALKKAGPELLQCEAWDQDVKGDKANMAKLPFDALGWYCQQDSWATFELYKICCQAVEEHKETWGRFFWQWFEEDMTNIIMLQNEAYQLSLHVDTKYIKDYELKVDDEIKNCLREFFEHEDLKDHIDAFNRNVVSVVESEVNNYGSKFKKDGSVTVNYQKALDRLEKVRGENHFNINSTGHLKWLLYDRLQVECKFFTDSGGQSMDGDALEAIPKYGRLVINYRDADNKKRFLSALNDNSVDGQVRISIRVPGTTTGRMSAGGLD